MELERTVDQVDDHDLGLTSRPRSDHGSLKQEQLFKPQQQLEQQFQQQQQSHLEQQERSKQTGKVEKEETVRIRPADRHTSSLLSNVRTWMSPVTYIKPRGEEEGPWWEHRTAPPTSHSHINQEEEPKREEPPPTSCSREDYQYRGSAVTGSTRFSARPQYSHRHSGNEDVNQPGFESGADNNFNEIISYQHKYDSRKNQNYPIAGKREGCFVLEKKTVGL